MKHGKVVGLAHLALLVLSLLACNDPAAAPTSVAAAQPKPVEPRSAAEIAAATPAGKVVLAYLDTQLSLAADDAASAQSGFKRVLEAARPPAAISDAALRTRIEASAEAGAAAKDLAAARTTFSKLSAAVLDWLRVQPNPLGYALRVANCPMAFNSGAKWLQASEKIANPYYGAEMLTCGTIDAAVPAGAKITAR